MCILCQQTSPKRWFGNRTMTSFCDVTNSAHRIQMTTLCRWMKPPPHEKFLRTPLGLVQGFLRCFRDPMRVPRIRENYHWIFIVRENRVPTCPYRVPNIFLKKTGFSLFQYTFIGWKVKTNNIVCGSCLRGTGGGPPPIVFLKRGARWQWKSKWTAPFSTPLITLIVLSP